MSISAAELLGHLRGARYADLDTGLGAVQAGFERGEVGEAEMSRAFAAFQKPDPALGESFTGWMEAHPGSYAAHAALANWLLSRAWAYRGGQTANLVSDQGWRGLHHHLDQAEACARHATGLTDNPLAAWLAVASVHNTRGCEVSLGDIQSGTYPDWYARPLEDNPHSLELRLAMLRHLRAEWGGSEEQMLAFVRQQGDSGRLGQGDMARLWAAFHAGVSHHALHFTGDFTKGVERARLAAELREPEAEQLFVALTRAGAPFTERRAALERFLAAAEADPTVRPGGTLVWALLQSGAWLEPLLPRLTALLTRWAEAGDGEAALGLGSLRLVNRYWTLPDPTPYLTRARDEGDRQAAELLVHLAEAGPGRDTPGARQAVLAAADLGSPGMSWHVYQHFAAFRTEFELDDRARYRYLLRAADAGNNDARFALAGQLRAGRAEVGEDGVLRPVDTAPIQNSLDYAKHLLERAAAEDHRGAAQALGRARERDWDAKTARRIRAVPVRAPRPARESSGEGFRVPWLLALLLIGGLFRACSGLMDQPGPTTGVQEILSAGGQGSPVSDADLEKAMRRLGLDPLPTASGR